ncbi:protein terminal ear1 homolog [Bidens hawaiensis]|uniref:protein terminal ear1 homolog n=1 Tax=Bidens hawaiensis TaxID=980011 RepID=UPI00404B8371
MNHHHILNPSAQEFRPTYHHPPPLVYYSPPLPPPSTAPTRTLLLSSVPFDITESTIQQNLEVFGDLRAVQMENITHGLVTVHFYNLHHAMDACNEIQKQHMQQQYRLRKHFDALTLSHQNYAMFYNYGANGYYYYSSTPLPPPAPGLIGDHAVWAQFIEPADGYNQGTLVVFNLDSSGIDETVKQSFVAFGCVKDFRGTHLEKNKMFVEFYDTRDAAKALNDVNCKTINGKSLRVEFSRPGGHKKGPKRSTSIPAILERPPLDSLRKTGKKQPQLPNGGGWSKHRKGLGQMINEYDPRFFIKEDEVISDSGILDSRTTVMIKNIPNKYSTKLLLNLLDSHCIHSNEQINGGGGDGDNNIHEPLSSYDFVYLPIDFMNKCNKGYGFVNMTSPEATMRLYKAFHNKKWEVFNSKKICKVSYARFQGLDALKEHFKISRFPCEVKEYMPVVFDPPRDGQRLAKPTSIVV